MAIVFKKSPLQKSVCSPQNISLFFHFTFRKRNLFLKFTVMAHSYSLIQLPLMKTCWLGHSCIFTQWETSAHAVIPSPMGGLTMKLCNRINVISSRSECFWRHFDSSRWGSSLPCVSSTRLSQGVSHSAVTELRGFRAAGSRWAWRGSSHPEMTDCFTGTKLC